MLLIFCNIPSKKLGNPLLPLRISASAHMILTPTEDYLLSCLHRELRSLAGSDAVSSYSLLNSTHTILIYCSFANTPSIQITSLTMVGSHFTCCTARGKITTFVLVTAENRFWNPNFSAQEMEVHVIQRRNECIVQRHRQQSILTSSKRMFLLENGRPYILANVYPSACSRYTQTRVPALCPDSQMGMPSSVG